VAQDSAHWWSLVLEVLNLWVLLLVLVLIIDKMFQLILKPYFMLTLSILS
jgi:hypothetical protein